MPTPLDPELIEQIRASLYEGRGVRLFGDEAPTTMLEPSTEMTPVGEAFFLGKLEKVAELLDRGFVVNIDSQGSILAVTPDRQSRYISTQETEIDVMDRLMVKQALEAGAKVSFEQDGSLVIDGHGSPTPPSAAHAAAQYAEFERLADAGDINAALAAGHEFTFDASTVADPSPAPVVEDPFDTAAELEAEAEALQLGVDAVRDQSLPEYTRDKTAAEAERVAAEGRLAMAKAEEESALEQASTSGAAKASMREAAADQRALAQGFRDAGDEARAAASEADAVNLEAVADVHAGVETAALAVADAADERVTAETEAVDAATIASAAVNTHHSELEQVLDQQEEQVASAREAAAELAEAERLEAALPDLEARGVEGLDRVRAAIASHRAAAEALVEKGNLRATTGIVVEGPGGPDEIDPDEIDLSWVEGLLPPDGLDPAPVDPEPFDPTPFDPDAIDPAPVDPEEFDPIPFEPEILPFNMITPDTLHPGTFDRRELTLLPSGPQPIDPYPVDLQPKDPHPGEPEPFEPKPIGPDDFEVQRPSGPRVPAGLSLDPPALTPYPGDPQPIDPYPTDPYPVDPQPIDPYPSGSGPLEPKPIGPDDFEHEWPSEPTAPAGLSLDLDSAGDDGAMAAPVDDFATEIADIAELEDDLDGLADL